MRSQEANQSRTKPKAQCLELIVIHLKLVCKEQAAHNWQLNCDSRFY